MEIVLNIFKPDQKTGYDDYILVDKLSFPDVYDYSIERENTLTLQRNCYDDEFKPITFSNITEVKIERFNCDIIRFHFSTGLINKIEEIDIDTGSRSVSVYFKALNYLKLPLMSIFVLSEEFKNATNNM